MLKKYIYRFVTACLMMVLLCGCSSGKEQGDGEASQGSVSSDFQFVGEETGRKDNSLDAYSAVFHVSANPMELQDGFVYGGWNLVLAETRAYVLQKHLCQEDYRKAWDELIIVDGSGKAESIRLSLPFTPESNNQIFRMGQVWGSDHLVCANLETDEGGDRWRIFELDENLEPQWDFVAEFLNGDENPFPQGVLRDENGNVHLDFSSVREDESVLTHYVVSPSGEVLDSFLLDPLLQGKECTYEWTFTENGKLLLKCTMAARAGVTEELYRETSGLGIGEPVFSRQRDPSRPDGLRYLLQNDAFFPSGDEAVTYADETGVYRSDAYFRNPSPLYVWENHGISVQGVLDLRIMGDGNIGVFYRGSDGDYFTVLTPTTESVEIKEITLVTTQMGQGDYQPIVNAFNKKYPAYRVNVRTDYDESRLLSELGTGKGPVLVDTDLVGFETHKKLWEPLDDLIRDAGLEEALFENALELCKIDGVTYGLPMDFRVDTVFVPEPIGKGEWTYEYFLEAAEQRDLKAIFPPTYLNDSKWTFIFYFLMHGLEDNYLIDADAPKSCINLERLTRVLDLAEKLCRDENLKYDWYAAYQAGEVLCVDAWIGSVSSIAVLKSGWAKGMQGYGDNLFCVGYPTDEGGKSYLGGVYPLAICTTAPEEDKEIARAFLLEAMSHDGQVAAMEGNVNFKISVRKDVFEEQIQRDADNFIYLMESDGVKGYGMAENIEIYKQVVNSAVAEKRMPREIESILSEELDGYFGGDLSREQLFDHLQNRVGLYLKENQ